MWYGLHPPAAFVSSVRAVLMRDERVMVVQEDGHYHLVPGGRREAGEGILDTLLREVLEETGRTENGL